LFLDSVKNRFPTKDRNGYSKESESCDNIRRMPSNIRRDLMLSYFYQKYTETYGIPIVASNRVSSNGMRRACYVVRFYLSNNVEWRELFFKRSVRIVVMASGENLLDIPEYNSLPVSFKSVRGLSATQSIPLITIAEENAQCSNDKYKYLSPFEF
jgi:hypothetical protein